jgi:hypothetical protein
VHQAAQDHFGQLESPDTYCFPSYTNARGFMRRCNREIPEVKVAVIL